MQADPIVVQIVAGRLAPLPLFDRAPDYRLLSGSLTPTSIDA